MAGTSPLRNNATGLIIAAVLALTAGAFVFLALRSGDDDETTRPSPIQGDMVEVVRAAEDIPARTEITRGMLEVAEVPRDAVLSGAYSSLAAVDGQTSRIPIYAGEQLVPAKVIPTAALATEALSFVVPEGMRAMAVEANRVKTAGGLLRPGDRVDVMVVIDIDWDLRTLQDEDSTLPDNLRETLTITVAQNIEVLAVEQEIQQRLGAEVTVQDGTPLEQPEIQPEAQVVTLALTPLQSQAVFTADQRGTIRMAVRGEGDTEIVELPNTSALSLVHPELAELIEAVFRELVEQDIQDALEAQQAEAAAE